MLRLSPFEVEYEDIQINNRVIAPTVLKQNVTKQRMPERNLLMKCRPNKSLVSEPNASQRNFVKEQMHKLWQWLLQITRPWRLSGRNDRTQPYLYQHDQSTPVLAHEPRKATHERNTYRDDKAAGSTLAASLKRWDVEVGTVKWTWHRNKGMAEKHTKSLV